MSRASEQRPDALDADGALRLATLDSARALGLGDEVGSLTPGKRADVIGLSLAGSPYDPIEDPSVATVFGGSPSGTWRRSSTDKPVTAKERPRGKRYAAPQAPPAGECWNNAPAEGEVQEGTIPGRTSSSSTGCATTPSRCSSSS